MTSGGGSFPASADSSSQLSANLPGSTQIIDLAIRIFRKALRNTFTPTTMFARWPVTQLPPRFSGLGTGAAWIEVVQQIFL